MGSGNLWDEAYDMVKSQDPQQVQIYEQVITLCLKTDTFALPSTRPVIEPEDKSFTFMSPSERQQQSDKIISSYLNMNENKCSIDGNQQFGASAIARNIIESTVHDLPDASLPLAGLCLCQEITDPEVKSDKITPTVTYIVSRMAWYNLFPRLLRDGATQNPSEAEFLNKNRSTLKARIIDLYREIILCEVQIVYHRYSHPQERFLIEPGDDSSFLEEMPNERVIKAENALACFSTKNIDVQIRQLVNLANKESTETTSDVTIQPHELERVLDLLDETDPPKDIPNVPQLENNVIEHLNRWLSSTGRYKCFNKERLLWVSGSLATGRKMIIKAIEQEYRLQNNRHMYVVKISFSADENGQLRLEDTTSIVKKLIYLVQIQQPKLVKHLVNHRTETKRKDTFSKNDMYSLSIILCNMVKDESFIATLFLIDGIDEQGNALDGPNSVMELIYATLKLSTKVRWLISSDSLQKHPKVNERLANNLHLNLEQAAPEIAPIFEEFYTPLKISELAGCGYAEDFRTKVTDKLMKISAGDVSRVDITCEALKRVEPWHAMDLLDQFSRLAFVNKNPLYTLMKQFIEAYVPLDQKYCFEILRVMAVVYRPLHITELKAIVDFPPEVDIKILIEKKCFAFLQLCGNTVCFITNSAKDFICEDIQSSTHSFVLERCLNLLSTFLSNNTHNAVNVRTINYAIVYWIRHLFSMVHLKESRKLGLEFLVEHHSQWQSSLASFNLLPQASSLLQELEAHYTKLYPLKDDDANDDDDYIQNFRKLLHEMKQAFRFHQLSQNQTRLSHSNALLFYPKSSTTRTRFLEKQFPELMVPPITDNQWSHVVHYLKGHSDFVRFCAYLGDGKHLASGSDDGTICIWNADTGILQHKISAFNDYVYLAALSPNGLLIASDRWSIKIWNANTGMVAAMPNIPDLGENIGYVTHLALSHDGRMLALVSDGIVTIWDLKTYLRVTYQDARSNGCSVSYAQFSNNNLLATVSGNCISIWKQDEEDEKDNESSAANNEVQALGLKKLRNMLLPTDDEITSRAAFSPDSKYVAAGTKEIYIWDLEIDKPIAVLSGHTNEITVLSFSPDGSYLASGSRDLTVRLWAAPWDSEEKKPLLKLTGHSGRIFDLSFSPSQKRLVTCSSDRTLFIWDYETGTEAAVRMEDENQGITVHKSPIRDVAISPDGGKIASASRDGLICLWEGKSGNLLRELPGHKNVVNRITFSKDSKLLASASGDNTVRVWDVDEGAEPLTLIGHDDWVRCAVFSPDAQFVVSSSDDRTLRVWNLAHENAKKTADLNSIDKTQEFTEDYDSQVLEGHEDYVMCIAFSPDGKTIASGGNDGHILLWDYTENQRTPIKPEPKMMQDGDCGTILGLTLDHAGLLIASSSESIAIWNIATRDFIKKVPFGFQCSTFYANNSFPEYIVSDIGPISLPHLMENGLAPAKLEPTKWSPYGFTAEFGSDYEYDKRWITWMGRKFIPWPKIHQPTFGVTHGHMIIVGCSSGRLFYFKFEEDADFSDRSEQPSSST
ncbi:hypothetical protein V8C34DRAFT_287091 [Trichoderma compactum]